MCTKNEKFLAESMSAIIAILESKGSELPESINAIKAGLLAIQNEEEKESKTIDKKFTYTGLDVVPLTADERKRQAKEYEAETGKKDKRVCEFTVCQDGEQVLRIFWDHSLEWIMQPNDDFNVFTPVAYRKFPKIAGARGFLKELAEKEIKEPGAFSKKYYRSTPPSVMCAE